MKRGILPTSLKIWLVIGAIATAITLWAWRDHLIVAAFGLELAVYVATAEDPTVSPTCNGDQLRPLDRVWTLTPAEEMIFDAEIASMTGDEIFSMALMLYNFEISTDLDRPTVERKALHFLRRAAELGNGGAMNEIGLMPLSCFQGVEQDIELGKKWLGRAASKGDARALGTLMLLRRHGH